MAETSTPPPSPPATGPLGGLRSLISRSKGIAAIGPLIGLVSLALIPIVAVTFIALYFAQEDLVRSDFAAGGGNTAGLDKVNKEPFTLYVTTYYPGMNGQEGGCATTIGEAGTPGSYWLRNLETGEIINHCALDIEERARLMANNKYELVSVFNQEKTRFAPGGIAVNNNNAWPNGTKWPVAGRQALARTGDTYWLQIPGLADLVPVIDQFGGQTNTNKIAQQRMLATGRDMMYRVDFAVKATGRGDEADNARITAALAKMNCQGKVVGGPYDCEVKGVNAYLGNRFTASNIGEEDVGPASGPSNEAEGAFTGSFNVTQRRFPAELFGGNKINTYYARPTYIVLHYLGELRNGQPMTVDQAWNYFKGTVSDENGYDNKYVQFMISQGGTITQALAETKKAAGACGFNLTPDGVGVSISIENEGNFEMSGAALQYTPAQVKANAQLVRYLMDKWHIPESHVISHAEAYQKYGKAKGCNSRSDPGLAFMNAVKSKLTEPQ